MKLHIRFAFLVFICVFGLMAFPACRDVSKSGFGIYLAESGEMVLTDRHIQTYERSTHTIELNAAGIDRWNSFLTYTDIPKLQQSLYQKDFIVKVNAEEIYRGKFWSLLSSMSYSGIVIEDAVLPMDEDRHSLSINFGYPSSSFSQGSDPRNDPRILDYFESIRKLK